MLLDLLYDYELSVKYDQARLKNLERLKRKARGKKTNRKKKPKKQRTRTKPKHKKQRTRTKPKPEKQRTRTRTRTKT